MQRAAAWIIAVCALAAAIVVGTSPALGQGSDIMMGGYGSTSGCTYHSLTVITQSGDAYISSDNGATWTLEPGLSWPAGLVDLCYAWVPEMAYYGQWQAFGVTASGNVYAHNALVGSIGASSDIVSIWYTPPFNGPECLQGWEPWHCFVLYAMSSCGDVYRSEDGGIWTYAGNVFGSPSTTEQQTWGELKGEFRK